MSSETACTQRKHLEEAKQVGGLHLRAGILVHVLKVSKGRHLSSKGIGNRSPVELGARGVLDASLLCEKGDI